MMERAACSDTPARQIMCLLYKLSKPFSYRRYLKMKKKKDKKLSFIITPYPIGSFILLPHFFISCIFSLRCSHFTLCFDLVEVQNLYILRCVGSYQRGESFRCCFCSVRPQRNCPGLENLVNRRPETLEFFFRQHPAERVACKRERNTFHCVCVFVSWPKKFYSF